MARGDGDSGYWSGLEAAHKRRILLWGGLGMTLLAAAIAAALIMLPTEDDRAPRRDDTPKDATGTPDATSAPEAPGGSGEGTGAAYPGGGEGQGSSPDAPSGSDGGGGGAGPERIAYLVDGDLWVANADGTAAGRVTGGAVLAYALSPDSRTLAYVLTAPLQDPSNTLHLLDLESGRSEEVAEKGAAAVDSLSWAPDSSWLAYEVSPTNYPGGEPSIARVGRDGSGRKELAEGHRPAVSPDGKRVALLRTHPNGGVTSPFLVEANGGGEVPLATSLGNVTQVQWASAETAYAIAGDPSSLGLGDTVELVPVGGSGPGKVRWRASAGQGVDGLYVSPDGTSLLFAAVGDDGHSQAKVLTGGKVVELSTRRDTYPAGWTRTGKVLFVEGNAFQGENTNLMCANADGTGRRVLVPGASR